MTEKTQAIRQGIIIIIKEWHKGWVLRTQKKKNKMWKALIFTVRKGSKGAHQHLANQQHNI